MSLLSRLSSLLRREANEARAQWEEAGDRLGREMDQREADMAMNDDDRLAATLEKIEASDDAFESLADEIRATASDEPD